MSTTSRRKHAECARLASAAKLTPAPWRRDLWAVAYHGPGQSRPFLVGEAWYDVRAPFHPNSPTRVLLFTSRLSARAWAEAKMIESQRPLGFCRLWAVRVRETVELLDSKKQIP